MPAVPATASPVPRALILAAGRGERMRPLSDNCPKPLLPARGRPLLEWHLEALARAGVREVVVNTGWLWPQFEPAIGCGARWGLAIHWQHEVPRFGRALETGGGIATALSLLAPGGDEPFWVVSGDVFAPAFGYPAEAVERFAAGRDLARLWVVPNPPYHASGDFAFATPDGDRLVRDADRLGRDGPAGPLAAGERPWTYANLALMRPGLVARLRPGEHAPLRECLFEAAAAGRLGGERWAAGEWHNLGTPADLAALDAAPTR